MKCTTVLGIATSFVLMGCQSPGQLSESAPAWKAVYQVPYERLANCIAEAERSGMVTVTPSTFPQERRARVVVTAPTGSALGVYNIRQISARDTEVLYSSIYGGPGSGAGSGALDKADRCGNP